MTTPILDELLERTSALRALARELVGDGRADDIVQEAAIQTMIAPPQRPGPAGGWLAAVVRNLANKQHRAERIRQGHEARAARDDRVHPDRSAEDADTLRRLTEIVTSLPEPYRGTILARYLREQTPTAIAAETGTPIRTVKTRLQRGLALLRERLDAHAEDWRGPLVAAFALDPTSPAKPILIGKTMKIAILAAVLLPTGYAIFDNVSNATSTPTDNPASRDPDAGPGSLESSGAARPAIKSDEGRGTQAAGTTANHDATFPGAARGSGTAQQRDLPSAATTGPRDLPTQVGANQSESPKAAADEPLLRIDAVGPAAFRDAFGGTNLGAFLASEGGEQLWRPLVAPVERLWQQWDGGDDFKAARRRVLDYEGRIRALFLVQPGEASGRDQVFGVVAMDADGSTDLKALAGDLARSMQAILPHEPQGLRVAGHQLQLIGDGSANVVSIPVVLDGCLVTFFGDPGAFDQTVPRCLRAMAADFAKPTAPLALHLDLQQLIGLSGSRMPPAVAKALGFLGLRTLRAEVRPNGTNAQLDFEVAFGSAERGVFAGLMPAVRELPRMLHRLPAAATPWLAGPFRPDVLFRAVIAGEAAAEDRTIESVRQEIHEELGMHMDTDLLDHLGGEIMMVGDLWQVTDPNEFLHGEDPKLGACIAWPVQNADGFRQGFEKLRKHLKAMVQMRKTRVVDGVKIAELSPVLPFRMHVAVGDDLFALGFGEEGATQLEALIASGKKAAGRNLTAPTLPAAVQRVRQFAPPGLHGAGALNLTAMLSGQVALSMEKIDDTLPPMMRFGFSVEQTQKWLDNLRPLVQQHKLENIVAMSGYDKGRWRLRLVW